VNSNSNIATYKEFFWVIENQLCSVDGLGVRNFLNFNPFLTIFNVPDMPIEEI